jgi:hypothetical protein
VDRRLPKSLLFAGITALVWLQTSLAGAAPKDAAASKLDNDAIYTDYLALKFGDAEKKLKQALNLCGKAACSPKVVAMLHRDLGTVLVMEKKNDDGKAQFTEALKADPTITLLKDLVTPELTAVWNAAKGGGPAPAAPAAPTPPPPEAPPSAPSAGGDDISHTPVPEQAILTPVPVYAELPEGMNPAKVQVRYKVFGATDWKTLDLKKLKQGYGAEIPCLEVGSTTGDLKYFIQAIDANGDVLATSGTRNAPHKVPIKSELSGDPPHLPGKAPSAQCANPSDCPPGLPGCTSDKKKKGAKGAGATCEEDAECESGTCRTGACAASTTSDENPEQKQCKADSDCESGQSCSGGVCLGKSLKNWISIGVQQDALFLDSASDACVNQDTYSCYFADNSWYDPTDATIGKPLEGSGDEVTGGLGVATTRILIGYDRLLGENLTLGARFGYAFNGGPQKVDPNRGTNGAAFFAFHAEGRVAYWLGTSPFSKTGLRPYLVAAGGLSQVDAKVVVKVYMQGQSDPTSLAAWRKAGTAFAGAGGGVMLPIGNGGIFGEVKVQEMLGTSATGAALTLGYAFGL